MEKVELRRGRFGWEVVVGESVMSSTAELEWAAFDALLLAEIHGSSSVTLGAGVPADALDRGRRVREHWEGRTEQPG
jgi:hypothetical protein